MSVRLVIVATGLLVAGAAVAEPMNADAARRFVVGKMFAYTCFDGTRGAGRIYSDGSVSGSIQLRGNGQGAYSAGGSLRGRLTGKLIAVANPL